MALLETMKKVAEQTGQAGSPTVFMFGTVKTVSPLVIRVDNRFDISEKQIVLMKEFRSGGYATHKHTVNPHDHTVPAHSTETAESHVHGVQPIETSQTGLETAQEIYFGLSAGDKVVLLRNQGGQEFLVLGRV